MDLATNAHRIAAIIFEYAISWEDSRKGPSNTTLAELVDWLSVVATPAQGGTTGGYACFWIGRFDLVDISPPAPSPRARDIEFGSNVLCLRRDSPVHAAVLLAHRKELDHCLAGQSTYAPPTLPP